MEYASFQDGEHFLRLPVTLDYDNVVAMSAVANILGEKNLHQATEKQDFLLFSLLLPASPLTGSDYACWAVSKLSHD